MAELFRETIQELQNRQKDLFQEVKDDLVREIAGKTGGDNWHDTSKLLRASKELTLDEIRQIERAAKPLKKPTNNDKVQKGHKITVDITVKNRKNNTVFHICDQIDTHFLSPKIRDKDNRMLSVDSPLGKLFINKSVGDQIVYNYRVYLIKKIQVSEYA